MSEIRKQQSDRYESNQEIQENRKTQKPRWTSSKHQSAPSYSHPSTASSWVTRVGGCWNPGKPESRVTTPWISVSFLELRGRMLIWRHGTVQWTWHWPRCQNVEFWPLTPTKWPWESSFTPLSLHHLNWKFRVLTDLLSALNSNKLHFYKEYKLSVVSSVQVDQHPSFFLVPQV